MNRSPMKRGPVKPKRKANPLKPNTRSAVKKGPARDKAHLERVRRHGCIGWEASVRSEQVPVSQAHHVRCIAPRSIGKRVSDYLTVPLCAGCHAHLHEGNEADFWRQRKINPASWIARFSKEGAAEIEALRNVKEAR